MTTLEELCQNISEKQKFLMDLKGEKPDKRNKAWELYDKDPCDIITFTYGQLLSRIEIKSSLTDLIRGLGSALNRRYKFRKDEIGEMHLGWFVFTTYVDLGILNAAKERPKKKNDKRNKHSSYQVKVVDAVRLNDVLDLIDEEEIELFPSRNVPAPWVDKEYLHSETGFPLVKKDAHEDAVRAFKEDGAEYLIDTLNRLGSTGWRINNFVFDVFKKAKTHQNKTPFKAMKEVDPVKRASLLIEMHAIERLAEKNVDNTFYHLYNVDFRGRIYPNTAFLHEQSSDNAKGLLLLDEAVALGDTGYYWLCVHTANMFGNDKVSLDDRAQFVIDNFDKFMSYVEDPIVNDDWMDADKPFCFLACCYELAIIQNWVNEGNEVSDFPSCLPLYIDGSNNGVQHLAAMTKDEVVAPLVNLVPQELPGDVYMYIAEKAMGNVDKDYTNTDSEVIKNYGKFYKDYTQLVQQKDKYSNNPRSDLFSKADQRLREFGNKNRQMLKDTAAIYWAGVTDKKTWRKTVKRPVMTLGYGGTQYGMVDMVHDDTRDLSPYLRDKHKEWSAYLGHLIYKTCFEELHGPAAMLNMFVELGAHENAKDKPIAFKQIVTGFPFVHRYKKPISKKVDLFYGDVRYQLYLQIFKEATLNKKKQEQSAAPNIVHSIDAVHLAMVVHDAPYTTTVVHDSFGCHAGNMDHMFMHVREKFVELYEMEPLEHLMKQMDAEHLIPKKGTLDVADVIKSDYAFA